MFTEDLSLFLDTAGFAESATWQTQTVQVIFDRAYLETLGISGSNPVALTAEANVPGVARGQAILIQSTNYTIDDIQPDGTGMVLLQLKRAA